MRRIDLPFYCLLILSLISFTGCSTTQTRVAGKKEVPPRAIQVVQGTDRLRIIVYSDTCFLSNGRLTRHCSQQLGDRIKMIKSYGDGLIQVIGYTDDLYDPQTATHIAQYQADRVASFLWMHGIGSQRLYAIGYGTRGFVTSNRSIRANSANRRVEIVLMKH